MGEAFPPPPVNDERHRWHCPAFGRVIDDGLCWECSMADHGGPTDTAEELRQWVAYTTYGTIAGFQTVCAGCPHCPWPRQPRGSATEAEPLAAPDPAT